MKITVYSTPDCRQCKMTKNWLNTKGVSFDEVDLSESPADLEAVKALGYGSAPVVLVNDDGDTQNEKHWFGFRPDLLEEFTLIKEAA
ncbi:MAG: NrdH-redoxin [Actinomycetota bacterium]|nr:NrdH-redoxin [Actinomycetota bacterium]